ncbi:MAG TPA: YetF domain-containing protein [Candidatus Nitrosocosmicus sp.]|nr:YetF domain-containing protein [Candidatus Nitrosocosmicus sp.]
MAPALTRALLDVAARTAVVYLALLVGLRITGKRQVGQFTPFDLLLLLLLANSVQNAMVGPNETLWGGLVAAGTLLALNGVVAAIAWRTRGAARILEGMPTILIRHGQVLEPNLVREGISREDLLRALREHGLEDPELVRSAILEVDGAISVLREDEVPPVTRSHHRIRGLKRRS